MVQTIGNDRFDLYQMDSLDSARAWGMFGVLWFAPLHLATGTRHPKNPPKPFSVIPPRKVFICFPSTCQMYSLLTYFNYLDLEKFGNSVRFSRQRHPDTDKYKVLPRPNKCYIFHKQGVLGSKILYWLSSCDDTDKDKNPIVCIIKGEYFSGVNILQRW